jgi:hypothetical protein
MGFMTFIGSKNFFRSIRLGNQQTDNLKGTPSAYGIAQ